MAEDKICRECKIILNSENWGAHGKKYYTYICKLCSSKRRSNERLKIKLEIIKEYGGKCACCEESSYQFLTIDHINNDGAEHRKTIKASNFYSWLKNNNYPKNNFQLLCFNCNCAKHIYGTCPHQSEIVEDS
jgi:hypothetical protein